MKKILVLNYDDHKGGGVIWTFADKLEEQGHQVFGVPFLKSLDDTAPCFVDVGKKQIVKGRPLVKGRPCLRVGHSVRLSSPA